MMTGKLEISTTKSSTIELYSKNVICAFTILFSTLFGALLLMFNLKRLKKTKAGMWVFAFGVLYSIFSWLFAK